MGLGERGWLTTSPLQITVSPLGRRGSCLQGQTPKSFPTRWPWEVRVCRGSELVLEDPRCGALPGGPAAPACVSLPLFTPRVRALRPAKVRGRKGAAVSEVPKVFKKLETSLLLAFEFPKSSLRRWQLDPRWKGGEGCGCLGLKDHRWSLCGRTAGPV